MRGKRFFYEESFFIGGPLAARHGHSTSPKTEDEQIKVSRETF
jgi:hypothetical protein